MDKKERFVKAYNYLKYQGVISKQEDVARAMGATRANVSLALNGNPAVLTDNFLMRFSKAYPGVFSVDWLITGDGEMLVSGQQQAKYDSVEMVSADTMIHVALMAKDETIQTMKDQLSAKDELIQAKDALIEALRSQIATMKSRNGGNRFDDYPFEMGVAESRPEYNK